MQINRGTKGRKSLGHLINGTHLKHPFNKVFNLLVIKKTMHIIYTKIAFLYYETPHRNTIKIVISIALF